MGELRGQYFVGKSLSNVAIAVTSRSVYLYTIDGLISCALTCAFCASIERRAVGHIAAARLHRNERKDRQLIMMMSLDAVLYTDDHETASEIGENCELV
jgi:hypothetical protein